MRYVFEESETTERYCIDYLPGLSFQKKSMEYLNFLQENNVNVTHQGVTKLIVSVPEGVTFNADKNVLAKTHTTATVVSSIVALIFIALTAYFFCLVDEGLRVNEQNIPAIVFGVLFLVLSVICAAVAIKHGVKLYRVNKDKIISQ